MQRSGKFQLKMTMACKNCGHEWDMEVPSKEVPKCPKCEKPTLPKRLDKP